MCLEFYMSTDFEIDKSFNRIENILVFIHQNIDKPLTVEILAEMSCWSRWQLQRVFQNYTGMNVAQYVREQRLSMSALEVLDKKKRMLDIAYSYGFTSEIAFSRAFKQYFHKSPREYQKQAKKIGIQKPFLKQVNVDPLLNSHFYRVRLEYKPCFKVLGLSTRVQGILSDTPDFIEKVPSVWNALDTYITCLSSIPEQKYAVIDTREDNADSLLYWAGISCNALSTDELNLHKADLQIITIPEQEYAVLPFKGAAQDFSKSVEWLISEWLPTSGHQGIEGFDLEIYRSDTTQGIIDVEYWLPIRSL